MKKGDRVWLGELRDWIGTVVAVEHFPENGEGYRRRVTVKMDGSAANSYWDGGLKLEPIDAVTLLGDVV